jgi:magnesium transporter
MRMNRMAVEDTLHESQIGSYVAEAVTVAPDETVASLLGQLRARAEPPPLWVAVTEHGRLRAVLATADLLRAAPEATVGSLPGRAATTVRATSQAERAAWLAAHAGAEVIAIEAEDGRFAGLVPAVSLLPLLVREHEIDLARVGGFLRGTAQARTASEEPVTHRVLHRAPWLLLGLLGAVLSARIVRAFEVQLEETVALAFFLPGIVYMADAVGTQTETLVIRGLSVGVSVRRILRLELLTGMVVGVLLSLAIFPMALLITDEADLSFAIAVSLMASTACATLVAMSLPWLMTRLSFDPAFGSGPLATVIQDLLSIVIYFAVGVAVVG